MDLMDHLIDDMLFPDPARLAAERERIAADTEAYLKAGGKIKKIPFGFAADPVLKRCFNKRFKQHHA